MIDFSRYWWCLAFFIAGFVVLNLGRRRHDLLLLARNESARRIPDLQYQPDAAVGGADLPQSRPPLPANPGVGTGRSRRKLARALAWIGVIFAGMVVYAGVRVAEEGVLPEVFDSGTPARATVVNCVPHEYRGIVGYRCNAMWSVGGASRTGPIYPLSTWSGGWIDVYKNPPAVGSQVDVHVRGGRAYQPADLALDIAFISGGLAVIAAGVVMLWYLRRKYRRL
ncbi:hypothetical protein [Mycobacterium sp. SP-6446]|uniref:hypothetical protein n=1 Tax=Mycobacterium sp. SP-6446 TaxID=1834162 RepID=UPI0011158B34|nr:hypothetical protein [Mycobacterium sp. SP-6446]